METLLMKGKPVADAYRETVSAKITAAKEKGIKVTLAIIVVGDDPASHVYKDRLVKLVESLGGEAKVLAMPETATQEEVIAAIKKLNHYRYPADDADAEAYRRRCCRCRYHYEQRRGLFKP